MFRPTLSRCPTIVAEPIVEVAADLLDLLGVLRELLLLPADATALSSASSVIGVAGITPSARRLSSSVPSCSNAAASSGSSGRNITTNSGDGWNCFQYSFAPSARM